MARRALPITLSSHAPEISFDEVAWRVGQANAILMRAEERLRARQLSTEPELSTTPVDNLPKELVGVPKELVGVPKEEARKPRPKVGEL